LQKYFIENTENVLMLNVTSTVECGNHTATNSTAVV